MPFAHIDRFAINEIGQAVYVNDSKARIDRIPNENNISEVVQYNDTLSDIASTSDSPLSSSPASFYQQPPPTIITTHVTTLTEAPIPEHLVSSRSIITDVLPLTEIYFDHVHKYVPMIHKPTFLKQMNSVTNPPSRFLLYAMCAVASRWSPDHIASANNHTIPPGYTYYQRALELIDDFIDAPRLATVQALILLVKYQEYFQRPGYFHRSHMYLGMAVRMSMDLGLTQLEGDSYEIETKRRTFWVAFIYDLLMSIEQGRTTWFDVHQCTTGFPLVTGEEGPALEELVTNQSILIQLGKVLSDVYAMTRRISLRQQAQGNQRVKEQTIEEQARLFSLHTHLENFLYEVPPSLIYPPTQDIENYPAEKHAITDPFIGFLHMTYHFSVILLHRIYVQHPPPKTEFEFIAYPHRQLCASSASNITGIVETLLETYPKYTFNYPARGVQQTIHCLAMAATIHKYEMVTEDNTNKQELARQQYMSTVDMIQQLSSQSPSAEFSKYYNHNSTCNQQQQHLHSRGSSTAAEKRMSAPVYELGYASHQHSQVNMYVQPVEKSKMRRNTLSAAPQMTMAAAAAAAGEQTLYQSSVSITDPAQLASLLSQPQLQQQQQQQHEYNNPLQGYTQQSMLQQPQQWQSPAEDYQFQQQFRMRQYQQQQIQMTGGWSQQQPQQHHLQSTPEQTSTYYNGTAMAYVDPMMLPTNQQQQKYLSVVPSQQRQHHPHQHHRQMPYQEQQQQQNNLAGNKTRRHTFSNPPLQEQEQYYPSVMMQQEDTKFTVTSGNINLMMHDNPNVEEEDTMMIDQSTVSTPHYDPSSGMSQLFLTDDQQHQRQVTWEESMISDTSSTIQRSEGHVMK
jgi:hypothetical protein